MRGETHSTKEQRTALQRCITAPLSRAVLIVAALLLAPHAARAADKPPRAVIIFDGSGSMWGRMGEQSKYDIATLSMSAILPSYNRQIALGLIAYGHRHKGDCSDIEVLAAPEVGLTSDIVDSIRSIRPRGKTPIASSLESAATLLADSSTGHIILLTDGAENCRKDLCETVGAIREASPGLTVSAIGLGLRERDIPRVKCVAEGGGGRMIVARTRDELRTGLISILDDVASGVNLAPRQPTARQPNAEKPSVAPVGPPLLQLRALQAKTGPLIENDVHWRVTRIDSERLTDVFIRTGKNPDVEVQKGKYRIEARIGGASAAREITIADGGPRSVHLPLNVARIDLQMAAPLLRGETIAIIQTSATGDVRLPPRLLTRQNATSERFFLPPGEYTIRRDGTAASETRSVSLTAGDHDALTFDTRMGTLKPRVEQAASLELGGALLHIVEQQLNEAPGAWQEVTRSAAPDPTFALPAGTYRLTTNAGQSSVRQSVTVSAGQTTEPAVALNVGRLALNAIDIHGGILPDPIRFEVTSLDGNPASRIVTSRRDASIVVPSGSYKIAATSGNTNLTATTQIAVPSGEQVRGEVSLSPARLTLTLSNPNKTPWQQQVTWQIANIAPDGARHAVWSGNRPLPEMVLAAGEYEFTVRLEDRASTRRATLAAGGSYDISLPLP